MYKYSDIQTVHLEITEKCNAGCSMCARYIDSNKLNPLLTNSELSIISIKKIFSIDFIKQLNHIYMCGNFGDPIAAKDTLKAFKYFRENNQNLLLSMNTNGSARTVNYFTELAEVIGEKGWVIFSIDGLKDTNHIYRKFTNFDKIIENAKAFIDAGGKARWEYIVFRHNEHQVEQAEQLSKDLGFESFQIKKSSRFLKEDNIGTGIEIPKNTKYVNEAVIKLNNINLDQYLDNVKIDCKVAKEKNLYISAEGLIQPCCWVAGQIYNHKYQKYKNELLKLIEKFGKENLNAHNYTIEQILNNGYFKSIQESWTKSKCSEGKLGICAKTCGAEVDPFRQQYI